MPEHRSSSRLDRKDTRISHIGRGKPGTRLKEFDVEEPPLRWLSSRGSACVGDSYSPTPKKETLFSFSFFVTMEVPKMRRYFFFYTCKLSRQSHYTLELQFCIVIILDSPIIATKVASNLTLPYLSSDDRTPGPPAHPSLACGKKKQNMETMRLQTHVDAAFEGDEILFPVLILSLSLRLRLHEGARWPVSKEPFIFVLSLLLLP